MRLAIIWFASWKNAGATYVPLWVKKDRQRFPIAVSKPRPDGGRGRGGFSQSSLSPLGEETLKADAKAYRMLMRHIKEFDPQHTVILMQIENESGLLGDSRDRSGLAEAAWAKPVPVDLMDYFVKNKQNLLQEMQEVWGRNGYKTSGTWAEVFGTDEWADEVFMAYYVGRFHGKVAEAGKAELNIPMYANAWLGPQPGETLPGQYPSGGPVARVMDIWHAAAPQIDFIGPDIYIPDFKGTCALYVRAGNPLFFPEARDMVGNLLWAIGKHAAMGVSPFGIEDLAVDGQVSQAYKALGEMIPQLTEWQAAGKVAGVLLLDGEESESVSLGGYKITIARSRGRGRGGADPATPGPAGAGRGGTAAAGQANTAAPALAPQPPAPQAAALPALLAGGVSTGSRAMALDSRPFGIIVNTAPDEFLFIGSALNPSFTADSPGPGNVAAGSIDEGRYEKGKWIPGRRLNGDERGRGLAAGSIGMLKIKLYRYE
jgi:hypothetical protein